MIVQLMTASPSQFQFHLIALIAGTAPGMGCRKTPQRRKTTWKNFFRRRSYSGNFHAAWPIL